MHDENKIIKKIDEVIGELSLPLTSKEAAEGWTERGKVAIEAFFKELRSKILSGEPLPSLSIARGLDHWGVVNGELLEKSAKISNDLRNIKEMKTP
jgi:hypothetical protein